MLRECCSTPYIFNGGSTKAPPIPFATSPCLSPCSLTSSVQVLTKWLTIRLFRRYCKCLFRLSIFFSHHLKVSRNFCLISVIYVLFTFHIFVWESEIVCSIRRCYQRPPASRFSDSGIVCATMNKGFDFVIRDGNCACLQCLAGGPTRMSSLICFAISKCACLMDQREYFVVRRKEFFACLVDQ